MKQDLKLYFFTISVGQAIPALSHTQTWLEEFSLHFSEVIVYSTHVSVDSDELPTNVKIVKLGGGSLRARLLATMRLLRLIPRLILEKNRSVSLFHMSTKSLVIVGPFFKLLNIPIALWYSHKVAPTLLKVSLPIVDIVFTPTSRTFPVNTNKLYPTGHGLALENACSPDRSVSSRRKNLIVVLGRVARVKRIENIIYAVKMSKHPYMEIECIGPTDDIEYLNFLKELADKLSVSLHIVGPMSRDKLLDLLLKRSFVYSGTQGSVDKAPLEAAANGCFVITTNRELDNLSGMNTFWEKTFANQEHSLPLESRLNLLLDAERNESRRSDLIEYTRKRNDLSVLVERISTQLVSLKEKT